MDKFFQGLPFEIALWGNMLVSMIGAIFVYGAPAPENRKRLKLFFLLFWIALIIYYLARSVEPSLNATRLRMFLSPWRDFSVNPSQRFWFLLVILADLPILALFLGHIWNRVKVTKHAILCSVIAFLLFAAVWLVDFWFRNNAASSLFAFSVFLHTAWSCRIEHISSSILWITYALLHTPIGLAAAMPIEWRHTIFVVLLVSKLSLIAAMYNMLEAKKAA